MSLLLDPKPTSPACTGQLIVLAAGKGTRMAALTENIPKTLIPVVENRCILEINVENIRRSEAAGNVCVVGGHAWTSLEAHLARYSGCEVRLAGIFNPDYDAAGPCRSIQVALAEASHSDRVTVVNGDTIFSDEAFRRMKLEEPGLFILGSRVRRTEADDLVIDPAADGKVRSATKAELRRGSAIVSTGMLVAVGRNAINMLSNALTSVLKREKETGRPLPWHETLSYFWTRGAPAQLLLIDRLAWYEFDSISCISRFQALSAMVC